MKKIRVLFLSANNAARSQIAEALLNYLGFGEFEAESAGLKLRTINPLAIQVMREMGIDISSNKAKEAFDLYKEGKIFQYVISIYDELQHEKCPVYPGVIKRITWSYPNPADIVEKKEVILEKVREIRDSMKFKIEEFINEVRSQHKEVNML